MKWITFINERFPIASHLTMILLFIATHYFFINKEVAISNFSLVITIFTIILFFFKMRLYDEIKDFDHDLIYNKNRPLPRGLILINEVKVFIIIILILELIPFYFLGFNVFISMLIAVLYSLLMYKEFFIGKLIRPHLTTYALLHTIVTFFMSLAIFSAFTNLSLWDLNSKYYYFAILHWPIFNIFEFGRKTFASIEERNNIESYSKIFGRIGSVLLVISMSILALIFMNKIFNSIDIKQIILMSIFIIVGIFYLIKNTVRSAKVYRAFSSIYIVLFYILVLTNLIQRS